MQRRVQNPVRHLRWSFFNRFLLYLLSKTLFFKRKPWLCFQKYLDLDIPERLITLCFDYKSKFISNHPKSFSVWKVSKYRVFSRPYFPVTSLNTGNNGPVKAPYLDTFNAVFLKAAVMKVSESSRNYYCWGPCSARLKLYSNWIHHTTVNLININKSW